jgi:RND family efflux transporter MFP subunit
VERPPRRRALVRSLALAAVTALAVTSYVLGTSSAPKVAVSKVAHVYPSQALALLNATGYVVPQTKADVASKATGRLEKLEVEEGMMVKKDQVLARIENQDLVAGMNQALANIEVAKTNLAKAEAEQREAALILNRSRALLPKKFVSQNAYDADVARHATAVAQVANAKASIVAARAAYRAARMAVEYTLIRAPFDGIVLSKHANVGDVLAPLSPATESKGAVVSMADMSTLQVEADVSESSLLQVRLGQPCEIQLDALPDVRLRGAVNRIVPTVDRAKATIMVKVDFLDKDSRILPDMSAKVAFLSRELGNEELQPVTVVSPSAIVERDGHPVAFLVQGERVKTVVVETAGKVGDLAVVTKGLALGDQVVLQPPERLADGSEIRPDETR